MIIKNKIQNFAEKLSEDLYSIVDENKCNKVSYEGISKVINEALSIDSVLYDVYEIFLYDKDTYYHSLRVTVLSLSIGMSLQMEEDSLYELSVGALLHDIGKTKIEQTIINKNGFLTDEEYELIKNHPTIGYNIIRNKNDIPELSKVSIIEHHERLDGSGYPNGKFGHEIAEISKVIAVADVYDALVSKRCYKEEMSPKSAITLLKNEDGALLDDEYLNALISCQCAMQY